MSKQKVLFYPKDKNAEMLVPPPKPAKKYFPEYFKEMPTEIKKGTQGWASAKSCMPFIDSLSSGYIQELPCDVYVSYVGKNDSSGEDLIKLSWAGDSDVFNIKPVSTREEDYGSTVFLPGFAGFYNFEVHWNTFWEPKTPKGYSTFYHHPSNHFDLPFQTMSGIIDTDKWSVAGPLPFLIKEGFEGTIPAGTPMYQISFIKRESWNSAAQEYDEKLDKSTWYQAKKVFRDGYKKFFWERKEFL